MMLKIQLCITEINILKYIIIENILLKCKNISQYCISDHTNAALVSITFCKLFQTTVVLL